MEYIRGTFSLLWKLYVGLIFAVTAIIYYPIIVPFLFRESSKKTAFRIFVAWSWTVRILCFYHVKRITNHPIPKGPYIIVGNHASYLDIFLIYSIINKCPFIFLGKTEILGYPLIKTYFKRLNIPVDRSSTIKSARSLVAAAKCLKNGWSLMIFPEGGIPDDSNPKMVPFKEGAFQLAKSLNVPIVPVTFMNNYRLLSDPSNIFGPAHPGISRVHIHPYFAVEEIQAMSQKEISDACFNRINAPILAEFPHFKE
jgi:1-acyl-sn-glycerol-3-phosphate acyltransferase